MRMIRIMHICAILLFMSAGHEMAAVISSECPTKQEIPSCEDIRTSLGGYTYHVSDNVVMHLTDHCEHGWYYLNGTFIADSTDSGKTSGFVKTLTMSTCLNLEWQVDCPNSEELHCNIIFSILDLSRSTNNDSQSGNKTCAEDKQDCNYKEDINVLPTQNIILIVIGSVLVVVCGLFACWKCCLQSGNGSNGVL